MKVTKTLDQAIDALNEVTQEFVHHSDRMLRVSKLEAEREELKEENNKLYKLLDEHRESIQQIEKTRDGWRDLFERDRKDHMKLQQKYLELIRALPEGTLSELPAETLSNLGFQSAD